MKRYLCYLFLLIFNISICMEIDNEHEEWSLEKLFLSIQEPAETKERFGHDKAPILYFREETARSYKKSKIGIIDADSLKKNSSFCCFLDMCAEECSTLEALAQHILREHKKIQVGTKILCSFRGCLSILSAHSAYKSHILRHLDVRNYCCRECNKEFVTVSDKNSHERKVHHINTYGSTRE